MKAGAGGSTRPPGTDERAAREPESAAFETRRIGGARRAQPPFVAIAFLLVLGGIVVAGLSGRSSAGSFPVGDENLVLASADATPGDSTTSLSPPAPVVLPEFAADTGPVYTSPPGAMQIQAKRHASTIFVHGDIDADRITWVYVGVLDDIGRVAGWTSVSLPGAAGPNTDGGPTMRFDIELAIPAEFQGRLWVRAQAYDSAGELAASSNVEIPAPRS